MLRARTTHYLLILVISAISLNSACSQCGKPPVTPGTGTPQPLPPIASELPFQTKEPPTYQAEIVISFSGADTAVIEQKYFTARDGEKRRTDYELSEKETMSVIENAGTRNIALTAQKKCAVDEAKASAPPETEKFTDFLTTAWLAGKIPVSFESLGNEDIGGVQLAKYRVRYDRRGKQENASEAVVWVNEAVGMPVRTEMFSLAGGQPVKQITVEFRNIKLSVDAGVFDLPAGCKNVPMKELRASIER